MVARTNLVLADMTLTEYLLSYLSSKTIIAGKTHDRSSVGQLKEPQSSNQGKKEANSVDRG